jgi:hypothetical protein
MLCAVGFLYSLSIIQSAKVQKIPLFLEKNGKVCVNDCQATIFPSFFHYFIFIIPPTIGLLLNSVKLKYNYFITTLSFAHLITTLSFARARSRSEVRTSSHFTHLITTLTLFWPIFTMARAFETH